MGISDEALIAGADLALPLDLLLVNAPLRDYATRPRTNDFTLPVLGLGYIATYAARAGFNVGILDAEARGLSLDCAVEIIGQHQPTWVGMNLLAPTYEMSASIAGALDASIRLMVGGHQAKAMPDEILADPRFARVLALVQGEGETRVAALLSDVRARERLPGVAWRDEHGNPRRGECPPQDRPQYLAPPIDDLPWLDRAFLAEDPHVCPDGRIEASMVASRGCPYDCAFCGAAVSANPDVSIRTRCARSVVEEMNDLATRYGVTAFRFVDDLFLGAARIIREYLAAFQSAEVGRHFVWDATGRINILDRLSDDDLLELRQSGCREVALGIESGNRRILELMDKRITPEMTLRVVERLTRCGIDVKGYFILGYPTETAVELTDTVNHVHELWRRTEHTPGRFRASVFEFRPYPGTPEWHRLVASGKYQPAQLLAYTAVDMTSAGLDDSMRERDEFNFSVGLQFGEASVDQVRSHLVDLSREQYERQRAA